MEGSREPRIVRPEHVVDTPHLRISEYFGCVASGSPSMSACVATVHDASEEAYQTPEFDEFVLILEGTVKILTDNGAKVTTVAAGEGVILPRGLRCARARRLRPPLCSCTSCRRPTARSAKWVWPGPCKYVPICMPAFTPRNCHREAMGAVDLAKDAAAMQRLAALHEERRHPYLYHCAQRGLWEAAKASNEVYYPPTFKADGNFTHATADGSRLVEVLNHFYKAVPGDWVCLKMTRDSLASAGIDVTFEATAPVGDTPAIDMGDQLFPHLQGGVPPASVLAEFPVRRGSGGAFVDIPGVPGAEERTGPWRAALAAFESRGFAHGFVAGAIVAGAMAAALVRLRG